MYAVYIASGMYRFRLFWFGLFKVSLTPEQLKGQHYRSY